VHGTVNDLAVSGAIPVSLSLNAFIEEGFEIARLDRLVASMAQAAEAAGVRVVCGDVKVLPRGEAGGVYFATTGLGVRRPGLRLGLRAIRAGDVVLVSGPVGDHGTAVLLAREQFGLRGDLQSDSASVLPLAQAVLGLPGLRFMRDPTRGGLATVAHEVARGTGLRMRLQETAVPIRDPVRGVCEMLGYDPLFLACEGRVVAVVAEADAATALEAWRRLAAGCEAAVIGRLEPGEPGLVLETELGGERLIEELEDDPLPRIC
jgi:hydrogenase expression/formation protein HypE